MSHRAPTTSPLSCKVCNADIDQREPKKIPRCSECRNFFHEKCIPHGVCPLCPKKRKRNAGEREQNPREPKKPAVPSSEQVLNSIISPERDVAIKRLKAKIKIFTQTLETKRAELAELQLLASKKIEECRSIAESVKTSAAAAAEKPPKQSKKKTGPEPASAPAPTQETATKPGSPAMVPEEKPPKASGYDLAVKLIAARVGELSKLSAPEIMALLTDAHTRPLEKLIMEL